MSSPGPLVEACGLTRDYPLPDRRGTRPVLAGVDLTLRPGEAVLITGASGSGKTTLLSILAGMERPSGGRLVLFGRDTAEFSEANFTTLRRERIGLGFQVPQLLPDLSARENALLPLLPRGLVTGRSGARVTELLAEFGLAPLASSRSGLLSGGEQQRVALARALAAAPELLLLDEPAAHLAGAARGSLQRRLLQARAAGAALLLTSHEGFGTDWVDRQLELADGRLRPSGGREAAVP